MFGVETIHGMPVVPYLNVVMPGHENYMRWLHERQAWDTEPSDFSLNLRARSLLGRDGTTKSGAELVLGREIKPEEFDDPNDPTLFHINRFSLDRFSEVDAIFARLAARKVEDMKDQGLLRPAMRLRLLGHRIAVKLLPLT
jgi:hypothetical protein